jgi:hypothetical protein
MGAKLNVEVLNPHRSQSRWFGKHDWTIAADRLLRLEKGRVEVRFDTHLVSVELRKQLKHFPVMVQFDKRRRFTGLVVFKPQNRLSKRRRQSIRTAP